MPQDSTTPVKDLSELAAEFRLKHPIPTAQQPVEETEWLEDDYSYNSEEAIADDENFVQPVNEKTVRTWKDSSSVRIAIVAAAVGMLSIIVLGLMNVRLPEVGSFSESALEAKKPQQEEESLFADDGDFVAESAYAGQDAAFEQLEQETKGKAQGQAKPTQPTTANASVSSPPIPQPTARAAVPPPAAVTRTAPPRIPYNPPVRSAPAPRAVTPTRPVSQPTPRPAPRPQPVAPSPRPQPSPVQSEPKRDPMEQWLLASGMGVSVGMPDNSASAPTPASAPAPMPRATNAVFEVTNPVNQPILGISIPIGFQMSGQLMTPISFSDASQGAQPVLIELEPNEAFPNGAQLLAQYTPQGQSQSRDAVVSFQPTAFIVDGQELPVDSQSILVGGKNGKALIAKQQRSGSQGLALASKILLGAGREGLGLINRPESQTVTSGTFGSSSSTNFGDSNVLAGLGYGAADTALSELESSTGEPELTGVWRMKPGEKVDLNFLQEVVL